MKKIKIKNQALIKSFIEVHDSIKQRQSVWLDAPTGSFHSNNPEVVKLKLSMLSDIIAGLMNVKKWIKK